MAGITPTTGLITGIPIQDTVDKLIALQAQPRDRWVSQQKVLQAEQAAVGDLTALTLGVQFAARRLSNLDLFSARKTTSSDPTLLTATAGTGAVPGQYQFVAVRAAQSQHALSTGLAASDAALGGGTFTVRYGGQVDNGIALADLNSGAGVSRGKIKITDRNGDSAIVDLRYAQTIDDVLTAINSADEIGVKAAAVGDHIELTDSSGGTGNLRVQEVGGGTTAAGLGLAGINAASDQAAGSNLVQLFSGIGLDQLRDGNGLSLRPELPDLQVTLHDGSSLGIDLNPADEAAPKTLGNLLDKINAADPAKLHAQISADGKRIELHDLTSGSSTFAVTSPVGGSVAEELGLTGADSGGVITGNRLISGLKTTLLASLGGGDGLGQLGSIQLTDRSGQTATVNLAGAETLDGVITAINGAGLGIKAAYNSAHSGLVLTDTTGQTTSNLIVADADGTNTATKLGLAKSVAATTINSGTLNRQTVSRNTLLSSYNGNQGVRAGTILVTDSSGKTASVNLASAGAKTIGDAIDAINALPNGVKARLNDAGDGIALIDTAGGSGTLTVADSGTGKAATDLHIVGSGTATTEGGNPAQLIDGSTTYKVQLEAGDTLDDLVQKLNDLGGGFNASVFDDGAGSLRKHLSLLSGVVGAAGQLVIDGSSFGLDFHDLTTAQDALLQIGGAGTTGVLVSSPDGKFKSVQPGLDTTLVAASPDTVTVGVSQTADNIASALQLFVDQYNKLRDKLKVYTAFDADAGTKGTLFGSSETLRLDNDLSQLVTGRYFNDGQVRSLAELGVSVDDQGKLALDKDKLQQRFDADPESVTEFFADKDRGFAAKVDTALESLVGRDRSLLVTRNQSLQTKIDDYTTRIDNFTARLDKSRERLLTQFNNLELVIGRLQNNLTAINQIASIAPISSSSSSSK